MKILINIRDFWYIHSDPHVFIGVGRGGGVGGGGGGGGCRPPNNLRGGANIPFGPPLIHPHFPSISM